MDELPLDIQNFHEFENLNYLTMVDKNILGSKYKPI